MTNETSKKAQIIWVVDAETLNGIDIAAHLKEIGHIPVHMYSAQETLGRLKQEIPDLILLNPEIGDMKGIELLKKLYNILEPKGIPILVISRINTPEFISQVITSGGFYYIKKPVTLHELSAFIHSALNKKYIFQDLQEKNERLKKLSVTDSMTGLFNHRYLIEQLERVFNFYLRFKRPFSFIMIDMDHFKLINDTYGHLVGDQVLVRVATVLTSGRRNTDIVGRYGGEEFALLLPEITPENAKKVALRIIDNIRSLTYVNKSSQIFQVSASLGIVSCPDPKASRAEDFISLADQALYKAKNEGGNCVYWLRNGLATKIENCQD